MRGRRLQTALTTILVPCCDTNFKSFIASDATYPYKSYKAPDCGSLRNRLNVRLYHNRNLTALTPKSWADMTRDNIKLKTVKKNRDEREDQ